MQEIGFKNFRRFSDYTSLKLGMLNYLVGTNNSGKSTAIKACILVQNNINNMHGGPVPFSSISFRNDTDAHLHLEDFLSNLPYGSSSSEMELSSVSGHTSVHLILGGSNIQSNDPSMRAPIKSLEINNVHLGATLKYDYQEGHPTKVTLSSTSEKILAFLADKAERENFKNWSSADNCFEQEAERAIIESSQAFIYNDCKVKYAGDPRPIEISFDPYYERWNHSFSDTRRPEPFDECIELKLFYNEILRQIRHDLQRQDIHFVEAHNASHNEILYEEDKNNYLAQTITLYLTKELGAKEQNHQFIIKWMKELNIGEDYKITRPFPECLKVDILSNGNWRSLGKMGTGSIQLFILLLRLSIAQKGMLFVEEPEQNLHPALQSKLADMFYEYSQISDVQVIVETHSEYLIRRTQVLAASAIKNGGKSLAEINDAMKVYYFPEDDAPYSMEYRETGQFECLFDEGFYDVAGNNYLDLLKRNY